MRRYTFVFNVADECVDPGQTIEDDLQAIKEGALTVEDLMFLANDKDTDAHCIIDIQDVN